jgi:copper chaperone CopZ
MLKRSFFITGIIGLLTVAVVSFYVFFSSPVEYARAEYAVSNMTCSSCVQNIQTALVDENGVGEVDVNVTAGVARVEFDPSQVATERLAAIMTDAGYPARLRQELSSADYRALLEDASRLGDQYVGRIGERLVSHADFQQLLQQQNQGSAVVAPEMAPQVWNKLVQQELILQDARRNGIVVSDAEVTASIDKMKNGMNGFERLVAQRFGSFETFVEQIKIDMTIQQQVEAVSAQVAPAERQTALNAWYGALVEKSSVDIFDPQLQASSKGGGSGCACCG